jgi:hypothetical protein
MKCRSRRTGRLVAIKKFKEGDGKFHSTFTVSHSVVVVVSAVYFLTHARARAFLLFPGGYFR